MARFGFLGQVPMPALNGSGPLFRFNWFAIPVESGRFPVVWWRAVHKALSRR